MNILNHLETVEVIPDPVSLIESMRAIGYSVEAAIADLIDNSISAQANAVEIKYDASDDPFVAILDNGWGMAPDELTNAMRHGSHNPTDEREPDDLGRFGLGLKTSSLSQCRKLTVVSRKDRVTSARRWDLDVVQHSGRWLVVDRLNYGAYKKSEKGRRVIAVGGLTLSRGLTLEGLCVSYFFRNSKAYDTLLQMGRWFGYRPGYEDICRIWMDPDVQEWFSHVANVVGELRLDIRRMHANRQPPSRFGMRVRSHPDALIVTALNKMRNAQEVEVDISYSECGAETPFLPKSTDVNKRNLTSINQFLSGLPPAEMIKNKCFWRNVSATQIAGFLRGLEISSMNIPFMTDMTGRDRPILSFIGGNEIEKLAVWDICLPQGEGDQIAELSVRSTDGTVRSISPRKRQFEKVPAGADYLKLNRQRVGEIQPPSFASTCPMACGSSVSMRSKTSNTVFIATASGFLSTCSQTLETSG